MKTPISEVEVVGYEMPFAGESAVVRRLTPWFRLKKVHSERPRVYLLPPFTITVNAVVDGYFVGEDTIKSLCDRGEGKRLNNHFEGQPRHTLWMNEEGEVGYSDRDRVRANLGKYALRQIAEAWRQVIGWNLEEALGCVGRALSAEGSIPDVWIAKGVIERLMKDESECTLTLEVAAKRFPRSRVAARVDEYVREVKDASANRGLAEVANQPAAVFIFDAQSVSNGPQSVGGMTIGSREKWVARCLFRGNPEGLVEALVNDEEGVARLVVEKAHGIPVEHEEEVKEHFRFLGEAVVRWMDEAGVEGARRALLGIRREGEKRAGQNGTRTRLYFAWMLQGLTAWYAEHKWGGVDGVDQMVSALLNANDRLVNATRSVGKAFGGDARALVVGWTPWVEARLLASVGKEVLRKHAGRRMRVCQTDYPLQWGRDLGNAYGEEADVAFVNECMLLDETKWWQRRGMAPIFKFRGYYVFARREYIEEAAPKNIDERVELAARGRLRYLHHGSDFARVVGAIEKRVGANGNGVNAEAEMVNRGELDAEFQRFINGETKVFLGGAHHAALLREWWACGEEAPVEVLLEPKDVQELMDDEQMFANRIIFADRLKRGAGTKQAREALAIFFAEVWRALCTVLENGKREERPSVAGPLLGFVYDGVAGRGSARAKRPWSFLTHREQLQWICTQDSQAVRFADSGRSGAGQEGKSVGRRAGKEEQKLGRHGASGEDRKVVDIRENTSGRR